MTALLVLLTLSFPGTGLATPGEIDPSDPSAGDFLDLDLTEYYRIAGYHDIGFMNTDTDFDTVRDEPLFIGTMQHISAALGEAPEYTGDRYLFHAKAAFRCLLRFPEEHDPTREYPLVVSLHGYGDSPESFVRVWGLFDEPDFIYACPRGPYHLPG